MKQNIFLYILVGAFLLVGVGMIVAGLTPPPTLQDASGLQRNAFEADSAYDFDTLKIWSEYGSLSGSDNSSENGMYYIAFYEDMDGQYVLFSVYFENGSKWKKEAQSFDFMNDSLTVDACFQSHKISSIDNDLEKYYGEAVDYVTDAMREYGINPIDSGLHLKCVCDEAQEYDEAASQTSVAIVGVVMLALAAALFFFLRKAMKKQREAALKAQQELENFAAVNSVAGNEDYKGPEF